MAQRQPEYVRELISVYRQAESSLIYIISIKQARGNVYHYQQALLKQVQTEIQHLEKESTQWANKTIPTQYRAGVTSAVSDLAEKGIHIPGIDAFAQLHNRAIHMIVQNTIGDLSDANHFVGRQFNDAIRAAGLHVIGQALATGQSVDEIQQSLMQKLSAEGINGIKDKRGRMISLDAYAETVARSTTREAHNRAKMNHLTANGYDLVQMSEHAGSCAVCAPLQGRVYSISGTSPDYPALDIAFGAGYANIHPNCRHVLVPYIPELADYPTKDKAFSNRPFDIDSRTKKQVDDYKRRQAKKRKQRNDRNQYQEYLLALGPKAPKSYSAFIQMKEADNENWRNLKAAFRKAKLQAGGDPTSRL